MKIIKKNNVKVNCIIPVFNVARYLNDAVNSLIVQSFGFDNINVIIVNDGSTDNTEELILEYQKNYDNIYYIYQYNKGVSSARNTGLKFCENNLPSEYTCFLDGDDKYGKTHIEETITFLENSESSNNNSNLHLVPDVVFIPIRFFEKTSKIQHECLAINRVATGIIDLSSGYFFFSNVNAALFKTECLDGERFDEKLTISEDAQFLIKILLKKNCAGWLNNEILFYNLRKRVDESSAIDNADTSPDLYNRIKIYKDVFKQYLTNSGTIPRLVQSSILYDIHWFKSLNSDPEKHNINFDVDKGLDDIKFIIQHIDDDLLDQEYIPYWYKAFFKEIKHGNFHVKDGLIEPSFFCGNYYFEPLAGNLQIQWINQVDNQIKISGFFVKPEYNDIHLVVKMQNKSFKVNTMYSYHNDKKYFLGREIFPARDFEIVLKLPNFYYSNEVKLSFYFEYNDKLIAPIEIVHGWTSRFYQENKIFIGQNVIIEDIGLCNGFLIKKIKNNQTIESSLLPYNSDYKDSYLISRYIEYFQEYRNKRIWLFIDRPTTIGDNAEALFRYCVRKKDGIEKYFVVPDVSYISQFKGMKKRVIIFGSFEYKFLLMFAEKVISSITFFEYINTNTNIPAWEFKKMVQALSSPQQVFLQHGVTKDYGIIDDYLNSTIRNIDLLITTTRKEYDLFLTSRAGFKRNQVKLTGFPRYDLLSNNCEKLIVFMPTWRKKYSNDDDSYNERFKFSELCNTINSFISNESLHSILEQNNFRFILKIHPKMQIQLQDFIFTDLIEIVCNEISYNELYEKASILVTDYSSTAFDFAYLKKPVIYYQKVLPEYEQDTKLFDYQNDGFGEVFYNEEDVINNLLEIINTDCQMSDKYIRRVEDYFAFFDRNNSYRVYKEIKNMKKFYFFSYTIWLCEKIKKKLNKLIYNKREQ